MVWPSLTQGKRAATTQRTIPCKFTEKKGEKMGYVVGVENG